MHQGQRAVVNFLTNLVAGPAAKAASHNHAPSVSLAVLGLRFALPEALRALSRQPYCLRQCRCGDVSFVSRHKPAEHRTPSVLQPQTLRRHASRPLAASVSQGVSLVWPQHLALSDDRESYRQRTSTSDRKGSCPSDTHTSLFEIVNFLRS